MQKKIYVAGMFDDEIAAKVNDTVSKVAGVTSCTANASKAHVLVDYDEAAGGIEELICKEITALGIEVLS